MYMRKNEIFNELLECVANETELTKEQILSHDRTAEVVDARYMLVYLLLSNGFRRSQIAKLMKVSHRSVSQIANNFSLRREQSGPLFRIIMERIKHNIHIISESE